MSDVARRYARAAVASAFDRGGATAVDALVDSLERFRAAHQASPELVELLRNPAFVSDREGVLGTVLEKLDAVAEAKGLLRLLAERDRIGLLDSVCREVEALADERHHRLRAHVVSAVPLTDAQVGRIARALEKRHGQPMAVSARVDPRILGGLVCRVGDLTFDSSLKHQLANLRERLERDV